MPRDLTALTDSNTGERLRILLIAEAANPEWVSVPLVGWSIAKALMAQHDVHLVTQIRNREAILRTGLIEGRDFTAIDSEAVARPVHRLGEVLRLGKGKGWTMVTALSARLAYPYFERKLWQRFGSQIRAGHYDIVHRVTPLTPTANSTIAVKCARAGVPFILGPLNGGVPWPKGFDGERRREREYLSYLRGAYRLSRGRQRMLQAAAAVIAGSRFTAAEMPASVQGKLALIPENGIDPARFHAPLQRLRGKGPLRGCFLGRLVPYKGPDMLLEAAAELIRSGQFALNIVGDGPMAPALKAQAKALGIDHAVTFHGWVDHQAVQHILGQADLLTFPSIREFGGGVVLEAMAMGAVPLICDYAGPAELVTAETGFKVAVQDRAGTVQGFRAALTQICADPAQLEPMARAAQARVADYFTWDQKARQISAIYAWARDPQGPIPQPVPLSGQGSHDMRKEI